MAFRTFETKFCVFALIIVDGRMLMTHWSRSPSYGPPLWTLPGGLVRLGEPVEDAVERWVRDQAGLDAKLDSILGFHTSVIPGNERRDRPGVSLHQVRTVVTVTPTEGQFIPRIPRPADVTQWMRIDRIGALPRVDFVDAALEMAGITICSVSRAVAN